MKNRHLIAGIIVATCIMLTSCAPRIAGTWIVARYEITTPGKQTASLSNIGTVQFNKNGTGEKLLNYSILGLRKDDQMPFKWKWYEGKYITIESEGSDFAKTWIIIQNKKRYQKWQSVDSSNNVQMVELQKQ